MALTNMQTMSKQTVMRAATIVCAAAMVLGVARAQTPDGPPPDGQTQGPPPGGGRGGRGGMNPERQLERMQKELSLTSDQTTQIKSIMADGRSKMEALRSNTALSQDDRRAQGMAMRQDEQAKIKTVLTPDQQAKYATMEARQRERMQDREQAGPPPSTPPQ